MSFINSLFFYLNYILSFRKKQSLLVELVTTTSMKKFEQVIKKNQQH